LLSRPRQEQEQRQTWLTLHRLLERSFAGRSWQCARRNPLDVCISGMEA